MFKKVFFLGVGILILVAGFYEAPAKRINLELDMLKEVLYTEMILSLDKNDIAGLDKVDEKFIYFDEFTDEGQCLAQTNSIPNN